MKVIPLFERVLLKPQDNVKEKLGNIILPESMSVKPELATVIAIGTGGKIDGNDIEFKVKVGDNVLFNKFASHEFNVDNETLVLISQTDILAIYEK